MATDKEKCFEEAVREYERVSGRDLGIDFQQAWTKDIDGVWHRGNRPWWALVNSLRKTWRFLEAGEGEPGQVHELRRPDLTTGEMNVTGANGRSTVVDLKFTRKNGTVDDWRPGQKDAYGEINRQQNGPDSGPISLSAENCGCKGAPEREPVPVASPFALPYGQHYMAPSPAPGAVPSAPGIRVPPVRLPPIRIPLPELVFP